LLMVKLFAPFIVRLNQFVLSLAAYKFAATACLLSSRHQTLRILQLRY